MPPTAHPPRPAPLAGVRVLDLSRVLAAPWCTMTLADLGAEVIKIEQPGTGDETRGWGPPFVGGEAAYNLCANRSKMSVAVDLARPEGQRIVRALAARSDVLVENFKTGGLARYGLDAASLRAADPRLIYCSVSGYGRTGPAADRPGYDYLIQAEGGLMAVTGEADGAPMKVGVAVADLFTGMAATQAILAALVARDRDGVGQHIDMALFDCQLAMLANVGAAYLATGAEPGRYGNAHAAIVPYQLVDAADAPIVVAAGNDRQFAALAEAAGRPDLAADPRFATNRARVEHREPLMEQLGRAFAAQPAAWWIDRLRAAGVPAGEVRSVGAALRSEEASARGMVHRVPHPTADSIELVGSPLKLAETPVVPPTAPPLLGEHSDAVLRDLLGLDAAEIATLREQGVVA